MRNAFWLAGLALATASSAFAQEPTLTPAPIPAASPAPVAPAAPVPLRALDLDELAELDGRQGDPQVSVLSDQDLTAVNNGNTITAGTVGSGAISIDGGAFAGFAGVGNFVINSGHNNNLQGALTINIVSP